MANQLTLNLAAMDDQGKPVDWYFMYKVPSKSVTSDDSKADGTEYIYYDANFTKGEKLILSPHSIADANHGALSNTLNQLYRNPNDPDLGWFFYNDEDPITGRTNSNRGHTKGVLAFHLKSNTAFWLIHSTPKFTNEGQYEYPSTAAGNGQTFLCITLKDADEAKKIAQVMYHGHQPNVYLSSKVPDALTNSPDDERVLLINNKVQQGHKPYANSTTFLSGAGKQFLAISKNKYWNKEHDDDFYNDLVAIVLNENIEVETWEHGKTPGETDADSNHTVLGAESVDLSPLDISPSFYWSEENDHAKLAVSDQDQKIRYVCVGGINFTIAQEKRSGGTVAFPCHDLWESLWEIISPKPFDKKRKE
jgi:deoxyribonuclease-2